MYKNFMGMILLVVLIVSLSACASVGLTGLVSSVSSGSATTKSNINNKLGVGILKLEGTNLQVTTNQAAELLLTWKAVKSLTKDDTVSTQEISALYDQMQEALTEEQVQAIEKMTWTQADMDSLMAKYGIDSSAAQSSKTSSQKSSSGGPGGGMPPPDGGGDLGIGGSGVQQSKKTSASGQSSTAKLEEVNLKVADKIIELMRQLVIGA